MNIEENVRNINTKLIYLQSQLQSIIYSTEPSEIELWIIILVVSLLLLCCCCPLLLLLAVSENFTHRNPLVLYLLCLCLARLKLFPHVSLVAVIGSVLMFHHFLLHTKVTDACHWVWIFFLYFSIVRNSKDDSLFWMQRSTQRVNKTDWFLLLDL